MSTKKSYLYISIVTIFVIGICYFLSHTHGISLLKIVNNFIIPFLLITVGVSINRVPIKLTVVVVGIVWYTYIILHYTIGFHNPFWT